MYLVGGGEEGGRSWDGEELGGREEERMGERGGREGGRERFAPYVLIRKICFATKLT